MTDQTRGILFTTLGVLMFVPDSLFIKLMQSDTATITFLRAFLAGTTILVALTVYTHRTPLNHMRQLGRFGWLFALFMGVGTVFFVSAVKMTSVANALFILSTSPIFSMLLSRLFLGEPISPRMAITIALSMVGIGVIAYGSKDQNTHHLIGDFCALGTAFCVATALTIARFSKQHSMVPATGFSFLLSALIVAPFTSPFNLDVQTWAYALILGCFFVPIGTSLMSIGPRFITSAEVSLILLLEAVLAPLLVWWVVGEEPTNYTLVGGALVIGVLVISNALALRRA